MGMFSSKGKSGRKNRKRAEVARERAFSQFSSPEAAFQNMFGNFTGSGDQQASQSLNAGYQGLNSILGRIPYAASLLTDPNTKPQFGLSAPGILDDLIARSQESNAAQTRSAAQGAANLMPVRGGASARAISDIYRGGAGESANIETALRAEAAQQDLGNRMNIFQSLLGGLPAMSAGMDASIGPSMDLFDRLLALAQSKAGVFTGLPAEQLAREQSKRQQRHEAYMPLGEGAAQFGGGFLQGILGGLL